MLKYTICFIKRKNEDKLLLLNRCKSPNMGLWNGVGGKIERNESPYEGIEREILEETGVYPEKIIFAGNALWKSNRGDSGMHIFIAELSNDTSLLNTPIQVDEGVLDWKDISWILHPENKGVVSNMKIYLPKIINGEYDLEHRFTYKDGLIINYETSDLTSEEINSINLIKA